MITPDQANRLYAAEDKARALRNRVKQYRREFSPTPYDFSELADAVAQGFQAINEALNGVKR